MNIESTFSPKLVALGASAGGVETLGRLLELLPPDFRIPVVAVLHQPERCKTPFADVFGPQTRMKVAVAEEKLPIESGHIYFAPSGYHLLIEPDRTFSMSLEPPENFSRPSIDVLFESAAEVYRRELVSVLLTGSSQDGALGVKRVLERGGTALVQEPSEALFPIMPEAALALAPALALPISEIAEFLSSHGTM